jgi:GT2 family glycosyltransferase
MTGTTDRPAEAVSIVVPNWNGRDLLRRHVPSWLEAARAFPGAAEVLVVDDGSKDDSVSVLEREFPGVRLVRHEENRGFAAACLTGARAATHPIVVLLNSDVTAERDFLAPLVRPFAVDGAVFAVSPLVLDRAGQVAKVTVNRPYIRRGELRWRGLEPARLVELSARPATERLELPSLFPLGGAVALDRQRFLELGGFDPLYHPFYYEDVDLGLAAWRRGWRCVVEPRSRVLHEDGGTIAKHFKRFRIKVAKRSHRLLCTWKHAHPPWLRSHLAWLAVKCVTKIFTLDMRFYVALFSAMKRLPAARSARKREILATKVELPRVFELINDGPSR